MRKAESREAKDRQILFTEAASFCTFAPLLIIAPSLVVQTIGWSEVTSGILSGLALSFLATGFVVLHHYRRMGLVRRRTFWKWALLGALGITLLLVLVVFLVAAYVPPPAGLEPVPLSELAPQVPILLVGFYPAALLFVLAAWVLGMGVIGTMAAVARRIAPWILSVIRSSGDGKSLTPTQRALRWIFAVPDVLDAGSLRVTRRQARKDVRWQDLRPAVGWQVFFGIVLAIYVSLNPFVADGSAATALRVFGILASGTILVPFLVLPWFLYAALEARIPGIVKDFTLFSGIRARILRSYLALGTIVIFVRWSLSRVPLESYVVWFLLFLMALSTTALTFSFLYFNYFENDLVEDVRMRFEEGRPRASVDGGLADSGPGDEPDSKTA